MLSSRRRKESPATLADSVYAKLKQDIFDFRLIPGDRFSETEVAERLSVSRTPVREALFRLQHEGYLDVHFRSGWSVRPFDFELFEYLYDLRTVLESAAIEKLCNKDLPQGGLDSPALLALKSVWLVNKSDRLADGKKLAELDEAFHRDLVLAAGNPEMARVHLEVTERIRIVRQLDFTQPLRIEKTYDEHAQILRAIIRRRPEDATRMMKAHIAASGAEVRKITLHRLYAARRDHAASLPEDANRNAGA